MPALSRRTLIALVVMVAGLAVIVVALVGGSGSSDGGTPTAATDEDIKPVEPLASGDQDARDPTDDEDAIDPTDPFGTSFGAKGKRSVTIRVVGNGTVWIESAFRGDKSSRRAINGSYAATKKVKGGSPRAIVAMQLPPGQLPGAASTATCTIVVDGIEVAEKTTTKEGKVLACIG